MVETDAVSAGRAAYEQRAWSDAYAQLSAADREGPIEPEDLERLSIAAYLSGNEADSARRLERAYSELMRGGDTRHAASCAFWLGFMLQGQGEVARASGWFARAQRVLEEHHPGECAERGFLLLPRALQSIDAGDADAALVTFSEATALGSRFREPDLTALGRLGQGQASLMLGRRDEAVAAFDEVMVAVTAGELSPIVVGIVYCGVISASSEMLDLGRALEWTKALSDWCAAQPDLVPYQGECLVHRASILQLHGAWPEAMDEAQRAYECLVPQAAAGAALYAMAELHRLRGELGQAEDAYRQASHFGHEPQPGLALLRLAQGRNDAAAAAVRRLVNESTGQPGRPITLAAFVEIMLAERDVSAARVGADQLSAIAQTASAALLKAMSAHAEGAVLLAEGDPQSALVALRRSWIEWQGLEVPYEAARVRVLVGVACRDLGDEDTAQMEFDAARRVFDELGAAPDVTRVDRLDRVHEISSAGGLSPREVQVLRLVATGKTNRAIAADLLLSEKTVARHLSNIFTKLGISSRSAATAYAYEHGLA